MDKVARRDRVPVGGRRTKLQLSDRDLKNFEGFHLHWFNDQDGRVEAAIAGGYDFVDPKDVPSLGSGSLHQENTDLNSRVSKVVSRGSIVIRAYLMKISQEFYDEDQAAKEEVNMQVDRALRPTNQGGRTVESGYTPK